MRRLWYSGLLLRDRRRSRSRCWHPARVAAQALVLLPALFPTARRPARPGHPSRSTSSRRSVFAAGTVEADIYPPSVDGPHRRVMLLLGAGDLPRSDVAVHFAEALARLGVVVWCPNRRGMLAEQLTFDEVDAIRASVNAAARRSRTSTRRASASSGCRPRAG